MLLKKILIVACLFITVKASAQINIIARGDTIILANGAKFWLGEQVTLTSGSNPDKSFNFIYLPERLHFIKKKSLPPDYAGKQATIRKFQKDGVYKGTYSYNILVLDFGDRDPIKYWCDVQGALNNNEIVNTFSGTRDNGKEAKLAHLKKLLNSGEITPEEYETLKNKILNNKDTGNNNAKKKDNSKPVVF
jgi:hypothetical protein